MSELKGCPLCGGVAEIWRAHPDLGYKAKRNDWIACVDGCLVLTKELPTDEEAISAWNRRPSPLSPETRERLFDRVDELERTQAAFCIDSEGNFEHSVMVCRCDDLNLLRAIARELGEVGDE